MATKHIFLIYFIFCASALTASAEIPNQLVIKYCSDSLTNDEKKSFSFLAASHYEAIEKSIGAMEYQSGHTLTSDQIQTALTKLRKSKTRSYKETSHGLQFQWYISVDDSDTTSIHPIISAVDKNSNAFKAGLRVGDQIVAINSKEISGYSCIQGTHTILRLYPQQSALIFSIKRSGQQKVKSKHVKKKAMQITFHSETP